MDLDALKAELRDVIAEAAGWRARAIKLERELVELTKEYADYQEHTARSHRLMVDEVDALERELAAARAGLARYGRHGQTCPARIRTGLNYTPHSVLLEMGECTCGFSAALERGGGGQAVPPFAAEDGQ